MGEREKQYTGTISYKKLFELMEQKGIKKRDLREKYNISPTIVNRLNNNSNVAIDTIMYLCEILNCQPSDIVEYIPKQCYLRIVYFSTHLYTFNNFASILLCTFIVDF